MEWRYPYALPSEVHSAPIVSQVASATFAAPTGADAAVATAVLYHDGLGSQGHAQAFAPDIASADLSIGDLPWLAAPELSLADQRLRWTPVGAGRGAGRRRPLWPRELTRHSGVAMFSSKPAANVGSRPPSRPNHHWNAPASVTPPGSRPGAPAARSNA